MATIEVPDPAMSHGEVAEGALDEAYERMARTDFELPNGFINHGPMACEALAVLGQHDQLEAWARWFAETHGEGPEAVEPNGQRSFDWSGALGDYQRLPEWLGFYGRSPGQAGRILRRGFEATGDLRFSAAAERVIR